MLLRFRKVILLAIILALTGSLYGWWRRDDFLGWYYFEQMHRVEGAERETWVKRLIDMDQAIAPQGWSACTVPRQGIAPMPKKFWSA